MEAMHRWLRAFTVFFKTVYIHTSSQPKFKGDAAEQKLTHELERLGIPKACIFRDLYVKTGANHYAQLDVVALTTFGILVFEVKNFSGWIFGKGYQEQWTQLLNYGRHKYRFYNPVLQNARHIEQLRNQLPQLNYYPVFNLVIFYGDCELKAISKIPLNSDVFTAPRLKEVVYNLKNLHPIVDYLNRTEILSFFAEAEQRNTQIEVRNQHIQNVRNKFSN